MKTETRLKQLRKERHVRQDKLASFLNIPLPTYRSYESMKVDPPLPILLKLSKFYKVSTDYILMNPQIEDSEKIIKDISTLLSKYTQRP